MANRIMALIVIAGLAFLLVPLVTGVPYQTETPEIAARYLRGSDQDLSAANAVTSVVVTYRGLDTLGEVTVLFAATAGVGFVLTRRRHATEHAAREDASTPADSMTGSLPEEPPGDQRSAHPHGPSEILSTGARFLGPLLTIFGVYIFVHGHLTPGGGFQGGVVIASGVVLSVFGQPSKELRHGTLTAIESLSGATYVVFGVLGMVLAAGFLDPRFLPLGETGRLVSAGAIPLIYSLVGLKVGSELSGVVDRLRAGSPPRDDEPKGGH